MADVDSLVRANRLVEDRLALIERHVQQRLAVQQEDVEYLIVDGSGRSNGRASEQAIHHRVALRDAVVSDRDEFAVNHGIRPSDCVRNALATSGNACVTLLPPRVCIATTPPSTSETTLIPSHLIS